MERDEAIALLAEGRRKYQGLLEAATELVATLDSLGGTAMLDAVQRRQEIVEQLQGFDGNFDSSPVGAAALAEFRAFREEATRKILEVDGLIIALARDRQAAIREKLATLSKSKSVSRAYEPGRVAKGPACLSESV